MAGAGEISDRKHALWQPLILQVSQLELVDITCIVNLSFGYRTIDSVCIYSCLGHKLEYQKEPAVSDKVFKFTFDLLTASIVTI